MTYTNSSVVVVTNISTLRCGYVLVLFITLNLVIPRTSVVSDQHSSEYCADTVVDSKHLSLTAWSQLPSEYWAQ